MKVHKISDTLYLEIEDANTIGNHLVKLVSPDNILYASGLYGADDLYNLDSIAAELLKKAKIK